MGKYKGKNKMRKNKKKKTKKEFMALHHLKKRKIINPYQVKNAKEKRKEKSIWEKNTIA